MIRQRQLPASNGIAEFDPFATPEPMQQAPDESPAQLLSKIHRLLRGRYILALALGTVGALAGAVGGYFSTGQKWQSIGAIKVERGKVVYQSVDTQADRDFESFVRDQIGYLEEWQTIERAMLSDQWRQFGRGVDKQAKRDFRRALTVDNDRDNNRWIKIRFVDANPQAAQVAVQQVVDSYKEIFGPKINLSTNERIAALKADRTKFNAEIKAIEGRLMRLGEPYGGIDLTTDQAKAKENLSALDGELQALERRITQVKAAGVAAPPASPVPDAAPPKIDDDEIVHEIARTDMMMSRLLDDRRIAAEILAKKQGKYPPTSAQVQDAVDALFAVESQITQRKDSWVKAHPNFLAGGGAPGTIMGSESLEVLEKQYKGLSDLKAIALAKANAISDTKLAIESAKKELAQKSDELSERERLLRNIETEFSNQPTDSNIIGKVEIVNPGEEASLYSDGRKKLAALGFLLGGSLPIFGVMLIGAMDRRYRYSDDAGSTGSQIPLLGILPYIPEAINDPEKASVAAHCVHQIRTLLQIGGVEHDRKVFAITSATSGDGKTSLSLSLGLSFAASGANTLLIDFDMIGGGLTAAMGARSDVGLLAAIDDGQLEGHVRPTAFPRLSIIPSGRDDAQEISRLSPKQVRRLIDQARKEFDVIVIDTGPILGSIEATLVCGIADGVVLALGRGQQRAMATRAIATLRGVGAHIMGIVFNRAQPNDFKRAVSQSVRSVPSQSSGSPSTLKALPAIGPMARTVASHIRPDA